MEILIFFDVQDSYVHTEINIKYKYIEQNLGLHHNEELEINASILEAIQFKEYALVHPDVLQNIFSLRLGLELDSLDSYNYFSSYLYYIYYIYSLGKNVCYVIY